MKIKCNICGLEYSKYGIKNHIAVTHEGKIERVAHSGMKGKRGWNKDLTKETNEVVRIMAENTSKSIRGVKRKPLTENHRRKIANKMSIAHAEGRAWNIGKSRWNNEPSYPEKFLIRVINENGLNKNYIREFNVGRYSIDFAWPTYKLAVEMDGEQHERFKDIVERDKRKDEFLIKEGWKILRIKWKEMFSSPKQKIDEFIKFINNEKVINW